MTASLLEKRFVETLIAEGFLSEAEIVSVAGECEGLLGECLLEKGLLNEEQLMRVYARQFELPFVSLSDFELKEELFEILPISLALKFGVVPYEYDGNTLSIVIYNLFDVDLEDKIHALVNCKLKIYLGLKVEIEEALAKKDGGTHLLRNVAEEFKPVLIQDGALNSNDHISLELVDAESAPAIKIINSLIYAALQKRASDIHIEAYEYGIEVKYRIDGVLYPATDRLGTEMHGALVTRIKVMSALDITEQKKPQDGRFKLKVDAKSIDFRVSILPGVYGEDINIRILDKSTLVSSLNKLNLENVGFDKPSLLKFRKSINEPHGMVLITGPTGSGKTTTLYSAISELNTGEEKIITIEDPVEYQLDGIVQLQVNESKGMTFSTGLRSILRHDPDKILVGEIRDVETAQIAVQSALTGHMVFSSVHANTTFDVISRFVHMGIEPYSLVPALNCIVSQRLIRRICEHCKDEYKPTDDEIALSGLSDTHDKSASFFYGKGCSACDNTGYRGRLPIHEILYLTDEISELFLGNASITEIKKQAKSDGMVFLREVALGKVYAGETTLHEVNRVTFVA